MFIHLHHLCSWIKAIILGIQLGMTSGYFIHAATYKCRCRKFLSLFCIECVIESMQIWCFFILIVWFLKKKIWGGGGGAMHQGLKYLAIPMSTNSALYGFVDACTVITTWESAKSSLWSKYAIFKTHWQILRVLPHLSYLVLFLTTTKGFLIRYCKTPILMLYLKKWLGIIEIFFQSLKK